MKSRVGKKGRTRKKRKKAKEETMQMVEPCGSSGKVRENVHVVRRHKSEKR